MKTLVVLAGGKSTRMGKDKVFLHYHNGETFLETLLRKAEGLFDRVIISAGSSEHAEKIRTLLAEKEEAGKFLREAEVIPDRYPEKGPMGGLVTVYEETGLSRFAVIAADIPNADLQVVSWMFDHCGDSSCLLQNGEGKPEPLVGAYGEETLRAMQALLKQENRRMRAAFSERTKFAGAEEIRKDLPETDAEKLRKQFSNITTEQDYRENIK